MSPLPAALISDVSARPIDEKAVQQLEVLICSQQTGREKGVSYQRLGSPPLDIALVDSKTISIV
jgi:hypothetical protein